MCRVQCRWFVGIANPRMDSIISGTRIPSITLGAIEAITQMSGVRCAAMDVPTLIELTRCSTGQPEQARIETLSREEAKTGIDETWWSNLEPTLRDPMQEPDHHWKWKEIVSAYQNKPYFRSKCIITSNGHVQAAMLLRVDAYSAIETGKRSVFVDRLATAPHNRHGLVDSPVFRGCGTGLLVYAVALSHSLGFEGRVNLIPVAHEVFYTDLGFEPTSEIKDGDSVFELAATRAQQWLMTRGLIDA